MDNVEISENLSSENDSEKKEFESDTENEPDMSPEKVQNSKATDNKMFKVIKLFNFSKVSYSFSK